MKVRTIIMSGALIALPMASLAVVPVAATTGGSTQISQTAAATAAELTIPVTSTAKGTYLGEKLLASKSVENATYKVKVVSKNQESIHPNSNIIIRSGDSQVRVNDVESASFISKTAEGELKVQNGKMEVFLQFGQDKVFSGGMDVILTKQVTPTPPPTPTPTPTPQPQPTPTPAPAPQPAPVPEVLPKTGATANALAFAGGVSVLGYGLRVLRLKRNVR